MRTDLDELTKEYDQVRQELQEFRQAIGKEVTSATDEASKEVASITEDVNRTLQESQPITEPSAEPPTEKRHRQKRHC